MAHRIPATLRKIRALESIGLSAPAKPYLSFPRNLLTGLSSTPEERVMDAKYQQELDKWVAEVDRLYVDHVSPDPKVD